MDILATSADLNQTKEQFFNCVRNKGTKSSSILKELGIKSL
jgi:hypothetical protein